MTKSELGFFIHALVDEYIGGCIDVGELIARITHHCHVPPLPADEPIHIAFSGQYGWGHYCNAPCRRSVDETEDGATCEMCITMYRHQKWLSNHPAGG